MRVLLTGMSGVGKSSVGGALRTRGYRVVDLDVEGYTDQDYRWNEAMVGRLLDDDPADPLFVIGSAENQPRFYSRFDLMVLLSAPEGVMIERLRTRTNNPFGKTAEQLDKILGDLRDYEPLMRQVTHHEIRTDRDLDAVVQDLLDLVNSASSGRRDRS